MKVPLYSTISDLLTGLNSALSQALVYVGVNSTYISSTTADPSLAAPNGTVGAKYTASGAIQRLQKNGAAGSGSWVAIGQPVASLLSGVSTPSTAILPDTLGQSPQRISDTNARMLTVPPAEVRPAVNLGAFGGALATDAALKIGVRRNIWGYTEDISNARYSTTSATRDTTTAITWQGIKLSKLAANNFYGALYSNTNGAGIAPFVAGKRYLMSYYVTNMRSGDQMIWMRDYTLDGPKRAHGPKLVDKTVRRVWQLVQATSTTLVDHMLDPTVALGSGAGAGPYWTFLGNTGGAGDFDLRVGGFQFEEVAVTERDGVALIGDSTMAGDATKTDAGPSREASTYLAALLNIRVFNRAVGGETTASMDARWATDMTPLAVNSKYAVIQGGINDISQGRTLADIQGSINSMVAKAQADGMIPVLVTCTPFVTAASDPAKEALRLSLNAWIKATFPRVIDVASVIEDPQDRRYIRRDPTWYGDGTHYLVNAKRAVGEFMARWDGWEFVKPSPYQPILATAYSGVGQAQLQPGTKAALLAAGVGAAGTIATISDPAAGKSNIVYSNGTSWLYMDQSVVS